MIQNKIKISVIVMWLNQISRQIKKNDFKRLQINWQITTQLFRRLLLQINKMYAKLHNHLQPKNYKYQYSVYQCRQVFYTRRDYSEVARWNRSLLTWQDKHTFFIHTEYKLKDMFHTKNYNTYFQTLCTLNHYCLQYICLYVNILYILNDQK